MPAQSEKGSGGSETAVESNALPPGCRELTPETAENGKPIAGVCYPSGLWLEATIQSGQALAESH